MKKYVGKSYVAKKEHLVYDEVWHRTRVDVLRVFVGG